LDGSASKNASGTATETGSSEPARPAVGAAAETVVDLTPRR